MRGKNVAQRFDAAGLRLAAGDPENIAEAGQRLRRRIGIGGLGIVDEQNGAAAADFLHAMREPGKRAQPGLDRRRLKAERQRGGRGAGGVLRVVQAAQRADAAELGDRRAPAAVRAHDALPRRHRCPSAQFTPHRNAHHALAGLREPIGDGAAPFVIDADDRGAVVAARRRRGVPSPPRNAPSCRGDRDGLR